MQKINVVISSSFKWLSELAEKELKSTIPSVKLIIDDNPYRLLASDEADVYFAPLQEMPFNYPVGIVITALRKREDPEYVLLVKKEIAEEDRLLGVPEKMAISVPDQLIAKCIATYFPTNVIEIKKLFKSAPEIAILPKIDLRLRSLSLVDYHIHDLHPDEFTPKAGQGTFAWICREDDLELRRLLKKIHCSETARLTNTERRIERKWQSDGIIGHAHCSVHPSGHYQLNLSKINDEGEIEKEKLSSTVVTGWEDMR